jgi:hypothetical protein
LTLVIVRAIQLGFYIGEPTTTAVAGWLALLGFAAISMIGALFTDDRTPFKVYIAGLGAPSLVAAFLSGSLQFSSPAASPPGGESPDIPQVGLLLVPTLYAEEQRPLSIEKVDLQRLHSGSISDGLRASIVGQRPPDRTRYLYVIGRTTDEASARQTAEKLIRDMAQAYGAITPPDIHLLRAVGDENIFVSVGSWSTALEAESLRGEVMSVFLGSDSELETTSLVGQGVVVDTSGLAAVP